MGQLIVGILDPILRWNPESFWDVIAWLSLRFCFVLTQNLYAKVRNLFFNNYKVFVLFY